MYKNLPEKLTYEYDKYINYLRLMSNADIIARSYEIAVKKIIYEQLIEDYESELLNEELIEFYMMTEDLIDNIYLHAESKKQIKLVNARFTADSWNLIKYSVKF